MYASRALFHHLVLANTTQGLFKRIGPIQQLKLVYDRAGRSEGVAFVTYESQQDAKDAIREFDGANAAGSFQCLVTSLTAYHIDKQQASQST